MILPSIDLRGGHAVQLESGKRLVLDAGDPMPWLQRFARVGEVAVVDLDAALGSGDNRELIAKMCRLAPCRVGGGIRDAATARRILDQGATKVVLGTMAQPELLQQLPRERCVAALDAVDGEVVVDGWRTATGRGIAERMRELAPYVDGFLVTFVEREGQLVGLDMERVRALREAAGDRELVFAGGVATAAEVADLDRIGVQAQVGMALYTERFTVADALIAQLPDLAPGQLWPTVVTDEMGRALGLCWSSPESLRLALEQGRGIYQSRRRGIWRKGETSGCTQELVRVDTDCDGDTLRFVVRQAGAGFCHLQTTTCWGPSTGLPALAERIKRQARGSDADSYTRKLLADPQWLRSKLCEEAGELSDAVQRDDVVQEAADVLYFASVALARAGASLDEVSAELDRRALRVQRRPGLAKTEDEQ
ncbi:MAG: phosphoribosyl-ATP diphosphatase [Planctomycetota bacterium]